jgi:hypothetical protein
MTDALHLELSTAALDIIEAIAAGNNETAVSTIARYYGQHDKLASTLANIAAMMLTRTPANTLADFRAYLLLEES